MHLLLYLQWSGTRQQYLARSTRINSVGYAGGPPQYFLYWVVYMDLSTCTRASSADVYRYINSGTVHIPSGYWYSGRCQHFLPLNERYNLNEYYMNAYECSLPPRKKTPQTIITTKLNGLSNSKQTNGTQNRLL